MGTISFKNNQISPLLKDKLKLKTFLASIFSEEGHAFKNVTYIFCTDAFLLKLNKEYLKHDTLTDVITFNMSNTTLPIVSEIYISVERVKENASSLKVDFENEMHRVMIHGILHLCGYSDHTEILKKAIRAKEDYYLSKFPLP